MMIDDKKKHNKSNINIYYKIYIYILFDENFFNF